MFGHYLDFAIDLHMFWGKFCVLMLYNSKHWYVDIKFRDESVNRSNAKATCCLDEDCELLIICVHYRMCLV
jgi:hypothetical protein